MPHTQHNDEISLDALKRDIQGYNLSTFRQDAIAGITVALLTLPQAMAYALLAGLPLSCGIFATIYSSITVALFGSSRQLIAGPSNAIAILIQAGTADILFTYYRDLNFEEREIVAVQVLTQLTFLVGLLQIFAAWLRLGRLTQFVSHSVVIGYIAGAALAMIINQLYVFLGIPRQSGVNSLYEHGVYLVSHLNHTQWTTALIGSGSLATLIICRKLKLKIPVSAVTITLASIVVEMFGLSSYSGSSHFSDPYAEEAFVPNVMVVGDTGEIYDIIPDFGLPFFNMRIINGVLPVAFAIALLSIMETSSVAKSIAASSGQRLANSQDILGIGLGNLMSSFTSAMPVSGSPSRSGLNFNSGAQTRVAAIINGSLVALMVFLLGFFVTRIPLAALAALLLVTAFTIVNTKHLLMCLKATNSDAFVLWATLLSCIFFSLDIAFYIGVILSITLYLKSAAMPQLVEYDIEDSGDLRNLDAAALQQHRIIRVIKVEGELFFGAADLFQTTLKSIAEDDTSTRVIILQLKNARDIDATVCLALQQLNEFLKASGRHLVACGLTTQVWEVLSNAGLVEEIGKDNLFLFDERHPHQHMQKALQWSRLLIASDGTKHPHPPAQPIAGETEPVPVPS